MLNYLTHSISAKRRSMRLGPFLLHLAFCAASLPALDPARAISQYGHDVWTAEEGLPTNSVYAITQTSDGYLWFGSGGGLARFDGSRFQIFSKSNGDGLPSDRIEALQPDPQGGLWIGTDQGISHLKSGVFQNYGASAGMTNLRVLTMAVSPTGVVWAGTRGGLFHLENGRAIRLEGGPDMPAPGPSVWALRFARDGALWIGSSAGLHRYHQGRLESFPNNQKSPANSIRALAEAADGRLLVASIGWFAEISHGTFGPNLHQDQQPLDLIRDALFDADGNLWLATAGRGLFRRRNSQLTRIDKTNGMGSDDLTYLFLDREKSLWVGTRGGGLHRFRDTAVTPFGPAQGLSGQVVETVEERSGGGMWVGTADGGLDLLLDGSVRRIATEAQLNKSPIAATADDGAGGVWVATIDGWLRHFSAEGRKLEEEKIALGRQWAVDIHFDRQRQMWIGMAGGGLLRYERGNIIRFTKQEGAPSNFMLAIEDAPDGGLWIGTSGAAVVHFKDGIFTPAIAGKTNPLLPHDIISLYADASGTLWAGGEGFGLARIRNASVALVDKSKGLFDNGVFQILEDGQGRLWMGSNRGIHTIEKRAFEAVASGTAQRVESRSYGVSDGMTTAECNANMRPFGWRARDGRLWFATARGLAIINPTALRTNLSPPPVVVTSFEADTRPFDLNQPLQVPAGTRSFEIHYAGLSYSAPQRNSYRYRLEPFEKDWVEAKGRRTATYTNLRPGSYRFHVTASNSDGTWNREGIVLPVEVLPHWYQTAWAGLAGALLCLLGVYGLHAIRMKQVEARLALVLGERKRIARELHDTLLQGVSGLALHLEAISHRMVEAPHASRVELDQLLTRLDSYLEEARLSISELRNSKSNPVFFSQSLRHTFKDLLDSEAIEMSLTLEGQEHPVSTEMDWQMKRIAMEVLTNSLRHSCCQRIEVHLACSDRQIQLQIQDDGHGFDADGRALTNGSHFGLLGIKERASQIDAHLHIDSRPGSGCTTTLTVPLSKAR